MSGRKLLDLTTYNTQYEMSLKLQQQIFWTPDRFVSYGLSLEHSCHTFQMLLRDGVTSVGNVNCYNADRSVGTSWLLQNDKTVAGNHHHVMCHERQELAGCVFVLFLSIPKRRTLKQHTTDSFHILTYLSFVCAFLSHWHCTYVPYAIQAVPLITKE